MHKVVHTTRPTRPKRPLRLIGTQSRYVVQMQHTTPMTTSEVAAAFGVDRSIVVRRVQAGHLTPVQKLPGLRGAYLFDRASIQALVETERNLS